MDIPVSALNISIFPEGLFSVRRDNSWVGVDGIVDGDAITVAVEGNNGLTSIEVEAVGAAEGSEAEQAIPGIIMIISTNNNFCMVEGLYKKSRTSW